MRKIAILLGFGGLILVLAVALYLDKGLGRDVYQVQPHDPSAVESNQVLQENDLWSGPLIKIYGNPTSNPIRVISPDEERIVRSADESGKTFLLVDKLASPPENPLQVKTVWFFTRIAMGGLFLLGVIGLLLPRKNDRGEE